MGGQRRVRAEACSLRRRVFVTAYLYAAVNLQAWTACQPIAVIEVESVMTETKDSTLGLRFHAQNGSGYLDDFLSFHPGAR